MPQDIADVKGGRIAIEPPGALIYFSPAAGVDGGGVGRTSIYPSQAQPVSRVGNHNFMKRHVGAVT